MNIEKQYIKQLNESVDHFSAKYDGNYPLKEKADRYGDDSLDPDYVLALTIFGKTYYINSNKELVSNIFSAQHYKSKSMLENLKAECEKELNSIKLDIKEA